MTVLRDELQRTLGDAYTLERELGGGGMSTVFVARDNALGRTVVIKVLPYELAATVSVERFKREIMLSAALQHPHIVPVLSAGQTVPSDDAEAGETGLQLPFFIMPYVEGESLRARLSRGPLSVREVVSILKDVARALVYAHGRGIIHRDIKPDNILLSSGSATVTDFGVAKAITASREGRTSLPVRTGTITIVGTSIGTPAYMAPEQAAGDPNTDHRADLYALGIVGYEMLVGTPPFHGRAPQQLLAAQLTEPPPPIATRRYDVPEALATLLMRLLEKEPAKRPRTAVEVARALEDPAVVSGTFVSVVRPAAQRPKRVLWALAGAGILASVAAGGAWFSNRHVTTPAGAPASTATAAAATAHGTSDVEAYDLYLRGRFFFDKRGEASLRRALGYFEQAAKKDSMFARAYAGIADVYALLPLYANVRADSLMPAALRAIDRAVELDSTLAEAFASRAGLLQAGWRWSAAEADYQHALRLDPSSVAAHQWYGELLLLNGRVDEARLHLGRAAELDPLSPVAYGSDALALAVAGASDSAIAAAKRGVELDSTLLVTRFMLGTVYLEAERLPSAVHELEAAARLDSTSVQTDGLLGYAYARSGNTAKASDLAKRLEARVGRVSGAGAAAARVYLGLGNTSRALTLLERAAADHDAFYSSESMAENFFDPIRHDPRFEKIVQTVGLDTRLLRVERLPSTRPSP